MKNKTVVQKTKKEKTAQERKEDTYTAVIFSKKKKAKKSSPKSYSEIQRNYENEKAGFDDLGEQKDSFETIIKTGIVYLPSPKEGEKPIEKKLTTAEVSGYRKKFQECKLEKKKAKSRLKKAETTFKEVSRRNATAAKNQITTINKRYEQKRKIKKNQGNIKSDVMGMVEKLSDAKDHRIDMLKDSRIY